LPQRRKKQQYHAFTRFGFAFVGGVLAAFAAGEIVVVTDDDDRENEGDL
jgi:hypothetical protein